jgi:hypothetical protein
MSGSVFSECVLCKKERHSKDRKDYCEHVSVCFSCAQYFESDRNPLSVFCDTCDKKVSTKRTVQREGAETSCFRACTVFSMLVIMVLLMGTVFILFAFSYYTFHEFQDVQADLRKLGNIVSDLKMNEPQVWKDIVARVRDLEDFRDRFQQGWARLKE